MRRPFLNGNIIERETQKMKQYNAAIFATYQELADAVNRWANGFFQSAVTAGAEQDEDSWGILLYNLRPEDREKFDALFQQYDTVGDYDPDLEWPINPENLASLPVWVSNRIVEELFHVSIERCAAMYDGVYFLLSPAEEAQDKAGICPVCGAEIEYTDGREDQDEGGFWAWECPACGATGREGFDRVFDRHYDVKDKNGNQIPGRPE